MVYVEQIFFNKMLMIQFNSTSGKCTGYTAKTQDIAEGLNKSPAFLKEQKRNEDKYKAYIPLAIDLYSRPGALVEPSVRLRSVAAAGGRHPSMLVCSVYDFFPKQIRVTWLRNGKEAISDVTTTEKLPNGNWLYQMHSYLEFTPITGEKIACMVAHASLNEPKLYEWDPTPESQKNKIAVGTAGLLLGLVVLIAGLIYYKKNSAGRELVPTS